MSRTVFEHEAYSLGSQSVANLETRDIKADLVKMSHATCQPHGQYQPFCAFCARPKLQEFRWVEFYKSRFEGMIGCHWADRCSTLGSIRAFGGRQVGNFPT